MKLQMHYAGENSKDFWAIINALPPEQWLAAYTLGVALQTLESQMLKFINDEVGPGLVEEKYWFNTEKDGDIGRDDLPNAEEN